MSANDFVTFMIPRAPDPDGPRTLSVELLDLGVVVRVWRGTGRCSVGSHPSNDLMVEDPTVSRFHAEFQVVGDRVRVVDLGSLNGSRIGGTEVERAVVVNGTRVRLGSAMLRVSVSAPGAAITPDPGDAWHGLIGRAPAMRALFHQLEQVATTLATVLLEGETGTGKEGAAEAIHAASHRREGPFVVVDCSSIPPGLIESSLFGHEQGAFTGASTSRPGAFEEADGGTLVLDEIGELPLELQPKLLRVLESRTVRRVGGRRSTTVDVRLVAATNRDLRAEVNGGRFRADLFFRLAVVQIRLPPLRERRDDLPLLVEHFLERLAARTEVRATLTDPEFLAMLAHAPWTGNVRELRNHIERCVVFHEARCPTTTLAAATPTNDTDGGSLLYEVGRRRALAEFERDYLRRLLEAAGGNVQEAARLAGIHRGYLYRLLDRHDLKR